MAERDGLAQVAIGGLLVALAVLVPAVVLYAIAVWADIGAARWALEQWRPIRHSGLAPDAESRQPIGGVS